VKFHTLLFICFVQKYGKNEKKQGIFKKNNANTCLNDKMELSLPIEDETKYRTGLIGILISNIYETENASHADGGPRP